MQVPIVLRLLFLMPVRHLNRILLGEWGRNRFLSLNKDAFYDINKYVYALPDRQWNVNGL